MDGPCQDYVMQPKNLQLRDEAMRQTVSGSFPAMHKIFDGIWLGTQGAAGIFFPFEVRENPDLPHAALRELQRVNITHIVCVCGEGAEWQPFVKDGIRYISCLLNDGDAAFVEEAAQTFGALLDRVVPFVDEAIGAGGSVLIHCNSGANRFLCQT